MTAKQILKDAKENGFFNWMKWNAKECAEWAYANYDCSKYVAKNAGYYLSQL